jgi:hypothetical protein
MSLKRKLDMIKRIKILKYVSNYNQQQKNTKRIKI